MDWAILNDFSNCEEATGYFYDTVHSIFNATVPKGGFIQITTNIHAGFPKRSLEIKIKSIKHMKQKTVT